MPRTPVLLLATFAAAAFAGLPAARAGAPSAAVPSSTALYPGDPPPHPYDALWVPMTVPQFDVVPEAFTEHAGHLVLAGSFTSLGPQRLQHVAEWDGTQLNDMGLVDPVSVHAVTDWNGVVVVGGAGAAAGSGTIERRNGTTWEQLATANGNVTALGTFNGDLVAAGTFTTIGGVDANQVALFDGSVWHAMGPGFPANSSVRQLLQYGPNLYAGGNFKYTYGGVARWDGTQWTNMGLGPASITVTSLISIGAAFYAGYTTTVPDSMGGCALWDDSFPGWRRVGRGTTSVSSLAFWNGALYGNVHDGTSQVSRLWAGFWSGTGDALPESPKLVTAGGKLYAVGNSGIRVYDGTAWTQIVPGAAPGMTGIDGPSYAATVANNRLIVGGQYAHAFNGGVALAAGSTAAWDGSAWSPLGQGAGGLVNSLGTFGTDVVALGVAGGYLPYSARWTGSSWVEFGDDLTQLRVFNTTAEYAGSLYTGGYPWLVNRWNGSAWVSYSMGGPGDDVRALMSWSGSLVAAGRISTAPAGNIAISNGGTWSPLGAGLDGDAFALATLGTDLVVGGVFTHAGGLPAAGVARWDGGTWHAMGTHGMDVRAFTQVDGLLYAAGQFRDADGLAHVTVARWSGTEWQLMGSGIPAGSAINWIEGYHGDLYAGGSFTYAFGKATAFIVRLPAPNTLAVGDRTPAPLALAAAPNPGRGGTTFAFTLPTRGHVRLAVFDPAGREVAHVLDGEVLAGPHEVRWTSPARPGVYFVRLDAPDGASRVARVVRLE